MLIFVWVLVLLNAVSFSLFCLDKRFAIRKKRRISEKTLLLSALFMGAGGAAFAMSLVRHKTKKPLFYISVPLLLICQVALLLFLFSQW